MKKIHFLLAAATIALAIPLLQAAEGGMRYTVTVTEFENKAGWHGQWDLGSAWGMVMTDLLNQSGRFIVLGESDMRNEAMAEQDFAASGRTAGGTKAPVTGQMTPAQLLVKGAITHVQDNTAGGGGGIGYKGIRLGGKGGKAEINATIYMVDSTTGQIVASTSVVGVAKKKGLGVGYSGSGFSGDVNAFKNDNVGKAVEDAVAQAVVWLTGQLGGITWSGSIVTVNGDKIYINRGTREGVASNQTFVVGEREIIRDPDTGEVLDEFVSEVAQIKCGTVREKLSICSVASGNAASLEKGMAVMMP